MSEKDNKQIHEVNELFYKALGNRDIELMKKVWVNDERAGCVHPGWTVLRSFDAIIQSWENIFDPQDQVDINLYEISLEMKGKIAWITCIQEMVYINRDPIMFNLSQSTNIFEKIDSNWLMLFHHASPLPINRQEINEESYNHH